MIGADQQHILIQFLLEAVIIAGMGSVTGIVLGFGCGWAAEQWFSMAVDYSLWSVFASFGVALSIGVASGIYPACKAARMQPIDALRSLGA